MNEIFNSFSSPVWWFSAVVVALIMNILSAYLKLPIDRLLSSASVAWRNRSSIAAAQYQKQVAEASVSTDLQILYLLEALTLRSKSNGWLVVVVVDGMFLLANLQIRIAEIFTPRPRVDIATAWFDPNQVLVFLGLCAMVCSMRCAYAAQNREQIVKQARGQTTRSVD